jgi:hypothetical protein
MKTAVDAIFVGRECACNRRCLQMCSHYLVGPVAVLAVGAADLAVETAGRIAVAAHEELVVLLRQSGGEGRCTAPPPRRCASAPRRSGWPASRWCCAACTDDAVQALAGQRERLVVLSHLPGEAAARIAAERRVPVLLETSRPAVTGRGRAGGPVFITSLA